MRFEAVSFLVLRRFSSFLDFECVDWACLTTLTFLVSGKIGRKDGGRVSENQRITRVYGPHCGLWRRVGIEKRECKKVNQQTNT